MLVTGREGQVASSLIERARLHQGIEMIALGRPELDLSDIQTIDASITARRPDLIVSAAAFTAVDLAETDVANAYAINGAAPGELGRVAAKLGIPVIHLSTDYVFDGSKTSPYEETDPTHPLGVYGASKLAGEHALAEATADHVILRTAWVYSPFGKNFLKTMLRVAADRDRVSVVGDQHGNPTSALDIADAIIAVAGNLLRNSSQDLRGIFHLAGGGNASWADFAGAIFEASGQLGGPRAEVVRISRADYPTAAKRPANSQLNTSKLASVHGVALPDWQSSMQLAVSRCVPQPAASR
ncbi:MAG: dTDP-4-dehydrorhamnose reductase [Rhizobium sp.]|nr:dTDP-4-dehydrorhamnose reductase [Rhizobium sp.]